jgi:hypothetical protein
MGIQLLFVGVWIGAAILIGIFFKWWLGLFLGLLPITYFFWKKIWLKTRVLMTLAKQCGYDIPTHAPQMRTLTKMCRDVQKNNLRDNEFDVAVKFMAVMVNSLGPISTEASKSDVEGYIRFATSALANTYRLEAEGLLSSTEGVEWMKEAASVVLAKQT